VSTHSYLAFSSTSPGGGIAHASLYADNGFVSELASATFPSVGVVYGEVALDSRHIAFLGSTALQVWNLDSNTFTDCSHASGVTALGIQRGSTHSKAYWAESTGPTVYKLYSVDAAGVVVQINAGQDTLAAAPAGTVQLAYTHWMGNEMRIPVSGTKAQAGYIRLGAFKSAFVSDPSWLAGDPATWSWYGGPSCSDNASCLTVAATVARAFTASPPTEVASVVNLAGRDPSAGNWDASPFEPEGVITSGAGEMARIPLIRTVPQWSTLDNDASGAQPSQLWCLD
jgi:hypothetical protein